MDSLPVSDATPNPRDRGIFEARYLAFLETVTHLRPKLHRYCARMTGSALDGEDVVQDTLFQAYRKLDTFDDVLALSPWIFRIAHNQCIDFLRRRAARQKADIEGVLPQSVLPIEPAGAGVGRAIEHLVLALPPKERACVLLKDVFDYSLEEVAVLVGSTVGGVKAALHRGRAKLAALPEPTFVMPRKVASAATTRLVALYVERFNRGDWDGLRELIAADARIDVADRYAGSAAGAPYFTNYAKQAGARRAAAGVVDGEMVVVVDQLRTGSTTWTPYSIVRIGVSDRGIARITDYIHCPWVLASTR
jgi:RNA polymerase sigma-70 factor (ECF subfamily)